MLMCSIMTKNYLLKVDSCCKKTMARQLQKNAPKAPVNSISADTSTGASANIGSVKTAGIK